MFLSIFKQTKKGRVYLGGAGKSDNVYGELNFDTLYKKCDHTLKKGEKLIVLDPDDNLVEVKNDN